MRADILSTLIGVIRVPVEWLKPIHSQGEAEKEWSGEQIRTQESLEI